MLEVLYKIPLKDPSQKPVSYLFAIIGEYQYGFMAGKDIQEPSLLATHLIQDVQQTGPPVQLISLDIEKAFDRLNHAIIIQALQNPSTFNPGPRKIRSRQFSHSRGK